jgi:3-hydroxyacyl-[acyl-carrier-protein] dehydratase
MKSDTPTPETQSPTPALRLPHRYPFLLLDRVLMVEPGQWTVCVANVAGAATLIGDDGRWPNVLLAEVMAQAAGVAAATDTQPSQPALLVQINRFRCRLDVGAGDQLTVAARVVQRFGALVKVRASIWSAGRARSAAELVLRF